MKKSEYLLQSVLLCGSLCLAGLLSQKCYIRADMTQQKTYTLSAYTKTLLDRLDSTCTVTWYRSYNNDGYMPSLQYVQTLLAEYQTYNPDYCLIVEKDTAAFSKDFLKQLGLIARQVEKNTGNTRVMEDLYSGLLCEYRGKTRIIPFFSDVYTLEADIARFIMEMEQDSLHRTEERSLYVVLPSSDGQYRVAENEKCEKMNMDRSSLPESVPEPSYRYILPWLKYAGFIPIELSLPFDELNPKIPLLVIGSGYFDSVSLTLLDAFLEKNGCAAFFVSGNTVAVHTTWQAHAKDPDGLLEVLARAGFTIEQNLIADPVNFRMKIPSQDNSRYQYVNYPFWPQVYQTVILADSGQQVLPLLIPRGKALQCFWPSHITVTQSRDRKTVPLLFSSPQSSVLFPPYNTDPYANHEDEKTSKEHSAFCIAAISTGKGRIFTAADQYCVSTAIEYTGSEVNMDFMVNVLYWIAGQDALLHLKQKQPAILPFRYIENEDDFLGIVHLIRFITLILIPIAIIIVGIRQVLRSRC